MIKYVEHDRELLKEEIEKHGKMATHDIEVPILLLYELGVIPDKNGNKVDVNKQFINSTMTNTNEYIKKKAKNPFSKFKSAWRKPIDEIEAIPIIKNHNTDDVDGIVGHIKGLLFTDVVDNKLALKGIAVIKDIKAKYKVKDDLLRNTSIGTRGDGSIKEVSFVINEAVAHGGLEMSEPVAEEIKQEELSPLAIQLSELSSQLSELENKTIPNHILLIKMIKDGKIEPYKYNDLINQDNKIIQLMESSISSVDVGKMVGYNMCNVKMKDDEFNAMQKSIEALSEKFNKNKKTDKKIDKKEIDITLARNDINPSELRNKDLKQILELMEYNPDVAKNYIKIELGEHVELNNGADIELSEYLTKVNNLKSKINDINIQLGEVNV